MHAESPAPLVSRRPLLALLAAIAITGAIFALFPGLDLAAASLFGTPEGFATAKVPFWRAIRQIGQYIPIAFAVLCLILLLRPLVRPQARGGPDARTLLAILLTFVLGPGLLINGVLKENSHRPRPVQVEAFGGDRVFKPWWDTSGACADNCSFASGEVAGAAAMVTAVALLPAAWSAPALALAFAFTFGVALLRMAFGGHFLSDALFAALLTFLVAILTFRVTHSRRWALGRPGTIEATLAQLGSRLRPGNARL